MLNNSCSSTKRRLVQTLVHRACKQGIKFKAGAIECCKEKLLPRPMSGLTFHFIIFKRFSKCTFERNKIADISPKNWLQLKNVIFGVNNGSRSGDRLSVDQLPEDRFRLWMVYNFGSDKYHWIKFMVNQGLNLILVIWVSYFPILKLCLKYVYCGLRKIQPYGPLPAPGRIFSCFD